MFISNIDGIGSLVKTATYLSKDKGEEICLFDVQDGEFPLCLAVKMSGTADACRYFFLPVTSEEMKRFKANKISLNGLFKTARSEIIIEGIVEKDNQEESFWFSRIALHSLPECEFPSQRFWTSYSQSTK